MNKLLLFYSLISFLFLLAKELFVQIFLKICFIDLIRYLSTHLRGSMLEQK